MPEAPSTPTMKPTLGLTGLTVNAMALIAPGAFLWLTFEEQALYGAPGAGSAMWFGILVSLLLCYATAISYAELSKLYPGAGSSYFYAEQAFLSKSKAFKYARLVKFFTGWASHLYYWAYPGLMVGVTALLIGKNLTPHRSIWVLCVLSMIIGMITVTTYLGGTSPAALDKHNIWYSFGIFPAASYPNLFNSFVIVTLVSNFGTFLLYMTTCIVAMVAFREHHMFHGIKHVVIPIFGLLANLTCMLFHLIGPFSVSGMSWHEPYCALGVAAVWGIYGAIYFKKNSKAQGREILLSAKPA